LYFAYAAGVLSLLWNLVSGLRLVRQQRAAPSPPHRPDDEPPPTLDVVVPVKDEEQNIAECIESVLAQDRPISRIVVVNDRSADGTARVVQSIQDREPRLNRVDITDLPAGLYGKPHAIHSIASRLTADYVAFVDSDLHLDPACLRSLVDHLSTGGHDWVAVMGRPDVRRFWERLAVPLLGAVIFAWYDPRKISDPKWPNAIGSALMVARRNAYQAIGGHGAVARIYDEDSELVRIAKRAGQKVSFLMTPELFRQRHYGTLARTIRGMTRTFVGAFKTVRRLGFTLNALSFISQFPLFVFIWLILAGGADLAGDWAWAWGATAGVHLLTSTGIAWLVYRTAGLSGRLALLHPLGSTLMMYICLRAMLHILRGESIAWRGTQYS
jgi:chlorobactene glucosyltransferase